MNKTCWNCKFGRAPITTEPCKTCCAAPVGTFASFSMWQPEAEVTEAMEIARLQDDVRMAELQYRNVMERLVKLTDAIDDFTGENTTLGDLGVIRRIYGARKEERTGENG